MNSLQHNYDHLWQNWESTLKSLLHLLQLIEVTLKNHVSDIVKVRLKNPAEKCLILEMCIK